MVRDGHLTHLSIRRSIEYYFSFFFLEKKTNKTNDRHSSYNSLIAAVVSDRVVSVPAESSISASVCSVIDVVVATAGITARGCSFVIKMLS